MTEYVFFRDGCLLVFGDPNFFLALHKTSVLSFFFATGAFGTGSWIKGG